jgi:hypothetical protein
MHYNVRGIRSKYTELEYLFYSTQFQFIGLCETLWRDNATQLHQFTNYTPVHGDQIATARGISILVHNSTPFTPRPDLSSHLTCAESVFIELPRSSTKLNKMIIIGEIYRSPSNPKAPFIEEFERLLHLLNRQDAVCYIMGDFNIDLMVTDTDRASIDYLNCAHRNLFYPLIHRPTRLASGTLLDHILTNSLNYFSQNYKYHCGILLKDLSDHLPVYLISHLHPQPTSDDSVFIKFQLINDATITHFKERLGATDWSDVLNSSDVNSCNDIFHRKLSKLYNECFPTIEKNP